MRNKKANRKLASDNPKKDGDWRRVNGKLAEGPAPAAKETKTEAVASSQNEPKKAKGV